MLRIFIFVLLVPSLCFGANYYVDPTYNGANGSSNGSFLRPWTNMSGQVRSHSFSTGDGLYFKSGTVTPMNTILVVNWHGTAQNRVIIGTYFGEDDFGNGNVSPSERAVLDGQNFLIPNQKWLAMIQAQNHPGYVTIQDLEIRDSGWGGMMLGNEHVSSNIYPHINQYFIVRNNYINRSWASGIVFQRTSHNQALNNVAQLTSYGNMKTHPHRGTRWRIAGASIEVTGQHIYGVTKHNIMSGNTVSGSSYEGLGSYKRASYTTITNNTVYDCSVNIYLGSTYNVEVSGNLVYATEEANRGKTAAGANNARNILLTHEYMDYGHFPIQGTTENIRIFNNYVAGGHVGIGVAVQAGSEHGWRNIEIFNNRIVDNQNNFYFNNMHEGDWQNNFIYGNYSFKYDPFDVTHTTHSSPYSFTWNQTPEGASAPNYFTGNKMPTGNAGQGASFNTAHLAYKTSWLDLPPGEVKIKYFSLLEEGKEILVPKAVKGFSIGEGGVTN